MHRFNKSFLRYTNNALSLMGKEVVFRAKVRSSANVERQQVVLGKVMDIFQGKDGYYGLKVHNYRRSIEAMSNAHVATDADGHAIRSYSGQNIEIMDILTHRGTVLTT